MANQFTKDSIPRRQLAKQNGDVTYQGYKPCVKCGNIERYTSNGSCVKCERERGLKNLLNDELMAQYRTQEKHAKNRERRQETIRENNKRYSQTERGKAVNCEKQRRRYARVKQGIPIEINETELRQIQNIYQEAQHLTVTTGMQYDVDHIIPLFEGGLHHPDNLQIITHQEHLMKTAQENSRRQQK
jgi:hypothetical protein